MKRISGDDVENKTGNGNSEQSLRIFNSGSNNGNNGVQVQHHSKDYIEQDMELYRYNFPRTFST